MIEFMKMIVAIAYFFIVVFIIGTAINSEWYIAIPSLILFLTIFEIGERKERERRANKNYKKEPYFKNPYNRTYSQEREKDYANYLNSSKWNTMKIVIRARDNVCKKCGSKNNLQVHHITYKNFGDEELEDLVLLCGSCHKEVHEKHGKNAGYYPIE